MLLIIYFYVCTYVHRSQKQQACMEGEIPTAEMDSNVLTRYAYIAQYMCTTDHYRFRVSTQLQGVKLGYSTTHTRIRYFGPYTVFAEATDTQTH